MHGANRGTAAGLADRWMRGVAAAALLVGFALAPALLASQPAMAQQATGGAAGGPGGGAGGGGGDAGGGANNTLALGGAADSSFDVSQIGAAAQYQGFDTFEKTGARPGR